MELGSSIKVKVALSWSIQDNVGPLGSLHFLRDEGEIAENILLPFGEVWYIYQLASSR
jgi:hypothetical protein